MVVCVVLCVGSVRGALLSSDNNNFFLDHLCNSFMLMLNLVLCQKTVVRLWDKDVV